MHILYHFNGKGLSIMKLIKLAFIYINICNISTESIAATSKNDLINNLVNNLPSIITESSKNPLATLPLIILCLSILAYIFFKKSSEVTRIKIFFMMAFLLTGSLMIFVLFQNSNDFKNKPTKIKIQKQIKNEQDHQNDSIVAENRIALVIGNSNYKSSPLKNPVNDAYDMAEALRKCNFQVYNAFNADKNKLSNAIKIFSAKMHRSNTVCLFYYAGHGIQVKGENYIIPIGIKMNSEDDIPDNCIQVSSILRRMESARNKFNIIILDACRDNPFKRSFRSNLKGLAQMDAPKGSILIYATAPGSVANDGEGRNGVYTSALLKYLQIKGMELTSILKYVRKEVIAVTNDMQIPWESSSLTDDFYFFPPEKTVQSEIDKNSVEFIPQHITKNKTNERNSVWYESKTGMEFVWIPSGIFQMGSPESDQERNDDEFPVHNVKVDGFWIGKFPVTNEQYRIYKQEHISGEYQGYLLNAPSQPVVSINWIEAKKFIQWMSDINAGLYEFRLPTEAEWEYSCRAGTKTTRYWGDDADKSCQFANLADKSLQLKFSNWVSIHQCTDNNIVTSTVGTFKPNQFGLFDMIGNMWEFCEDVYNKKAYYNHKRINPLNETGGTSKVIRGGSFYSVPQGARCGNRNSISTNGRDLGIGFRVVRAR